MLYADTSAVLPFYRSEVNSTAVEAIFLCQGGQIGLSPLVRVEIASAIARWSRMGEITESQARRIESALENDIVAGRYRPVPISVEVFDQALRWLSSRKTNLRTLDALHLAAAARQECCLLTADRPLAMAASAFGVDCQILGAEADER